ncbi:MAG: ACP S-malonyltransferase [bacterium]|nr:ACP S-malonyltransferase [bacterium]
MSRFAFLFPGQGAQFPGMGRELAEAYPESREVFDTADRALEASLSEMCFAGSKAELALTENTQPAILTVSVAALAALRARGLAPVAAAGHSLGEYSAHVCAGTFDFDDAVRAVRARGRFMQQSVAVGEGAMAAVLGLEPEKVRAICAEAAQGEVLAPANLNGPGQIVVAGHAAAVARVVVASKDAGALRAVPLDVSAPFHCALMEPAAEQLSPVLQAIAFRDSDVPVWTNVDARPVQGGDAAREALRRQVASPVRWEELMRGMLDDGIDTFVEVGPGRVLAGLARRIQKKARVIGVQDPDGVEKAVAELGDA